MEFSFNLSANTVCVLACIIFTLVCFLFFIYKSKPIKTGNNPIAIGISIASFVISIATALILIHTDISKSDCTFCIGSASTTVLSILVTILIGWNIYTVFDFKSENEKSIKNFDEINKRFDAVQGRARNALISSNYTLYTVFHNEQQPAGAITSLILVLSTMIENDFENNLKENNIVRCSEYLDKELQIMNGFYFGETNIKILMSEIKKIRENKFYSLIEDKFEDSFKRIEELISKEIDTANA